MATDYFLKLDGITGESQDAKHKGEFDLLSWSWGASNPTAVGGTGIGSSKAAVSEFSFSKYVDIGSPNLMLNCLSGKHIPTASITVRKAGENPVEYLKIKLSDVMISSFNVGASAGDGDRVQESVSIAFAKIDFVYTQQTATGGAGGSANAGWDVVANQKS
jgi:type VI secretion system secreted protein Hcp